MGRHTLTDEQVRQFRTRRMTGAYLEDLCREFGISKSHGSRIARGEYRKKAGGPIQPGYLQYSERPGKRKRGKDNGTS